MFYGASHDLEFSKMFSTFLFEVLKDLFAFACTVQVDLSLNHVAIHVDIKSSQR